MKEFVRISTSYWGDFSRGVISVKKRIQFLKKLSETAFFLEDCGVAGVDEIVKHIANLEECKDGIYEVVLIRVLETGHKDNWQYKLIKTDISGDLRGNKKGENGRVGYKKRRRKKVKI